MVCDILQLCCSLPLQYSYLAKSLEICDAVFPQAESAETMSLTSSISLKIVILSYIIPVMEVGGTIETCQYN